MHWLDGRGTAGGGRPAAQRTGIVSTHGAGREIFFHWWRKMAPSSASSVRRTDDTHGRGKVPRVELNWSCFLTVENGKYKLYCSFLGRTQCKLNLIFSNLNLIHSNYFPFRSERAISPSSVHRPCVVWASYERHFRR